MTIEYYQYSTMARTKKYELIVKRSRQLGEQRHILSHNYAYHALLCIFAVLRNSPSCTMHCQPHNHKSYYSTSITLL